MERINASMCKQHYKFAINDKYDVCFMNCCNRNISGHFLNDIYACVTSISYGSHAS